MNNCTTRNIMKTNETGTEEFRFLADKARDAGAEDARVIPADGIVVEDRVRQKCMTGCYESGKDITCQPHAPPVDGFRKSLRDYQYALLVTFRSEAEFKEEIRYSLFRDLIDPAAPKTSKESAVAFLSAFITETQKLHRVMLDLEQAAFNAGYPFALTTSAVPVAGYVRPVIPGEGNATARP
jgi:predicted metal-binding protein